MPGKKGMTGERLGGARPGAGRPCKSVELKAGDEFLVWPRTPDGPMESDWWTVESVSRTEIVFTTRSGDRYILKR